MKKTYGIVLAAMSLATIMDGCGQKELSRADAERIIREELKFPRAMDRSIFCAEPEQARIAVNSNLDEEGLLTISQDLNKPMIEFTEKASPYLLPTSEEDKAMHIQKIKLADEDLVEVTGIQTSTDGKSAVVEFTTTLKNFTPLNALVTRKLKENEAINKVSFVLYDDGWRMEKYMGH